ncbi:MAG: DUF1015 domain-containing protein [Clostridia bacterium]|nr:DUF1015 domain-containing protein [Clostridia bacterium]
MANIIPFKGYRYNKEKVGNLGAVMSPPYDSISKEEQAALYSVHENNVVRLVLGMEYENDTDSNNKYTRAANYLNEWIAKDILVRDKKDAIYLYEQIITVNDTQFSNKGFVVLLELEEFEKGGIMPCEQAITSSKMDRFNLLKATRANISMINCMYVETEKVLANMINELSEEEPDMDFVTEEGTRQRLWMITYEPTIEFIKKNMADKRIFITDGQNRYETCLEYKKQMMEQNPNHTGKEPYNYIMALLINAHADGLVQLPVHRLVSCPQGFKEDYFVSGAQDHFKVEKIIVDTNIEELVDTMKKQIATPRKENRIALYCGEDYFYRLTFTDREYLKNLMPDKSEAYRSLDVTVLNELLLNELLHIDESNYHEYVTFTKKSVEGVRAVKDKKYDCMFLINPTKPYQISEVAIAGEKMPERSICIFPKPATGIIINKH